MVAYWKCNFPETRSVRPLVGRSVGWLVCQNFLNGHGGKLHFHSPIGALVCQKFNIVVFYYGCTVKDYLITKKQC